MDEPSIRFGDKLFLCGDFISFCHDFSNLNYVKGYTLHDGTKVYPIKNKDSLVQGFVVDFTEDPSLALKTPFLFVDVTNHLKKDMVTPSGTKVWMVTMGQI